MFGFSSKPTKRNRIINRDPNNQLDVRGVSISGQNRVGTSRMSLRSSGIRPSQRGMAARARLNYSKMSKLGSGPAASRLQKNSFAKLQATGLATGPAKVRSHLKLFK